MSEPDDDDEDDDLMYPLTCDLCGGDLQAPGAVNDVRAMVAEILEKILDSTEDATIAPE